MATPNHVMLHPAAHTAVRPKESFGAARICFLGIFAKEDAMKLESRNPSCVMTAALLAWPLPGCGREPPPPPAVKVVPVPALPATQEAAKAEPAKPSAEAARAAADKALAGRAKAALP